MIRAFLLLIAAAFLPTAAWAQVCPVGSTCAPLETYIYGQSAASAPYSSGLRIPVAPGSTASTLQYIPGNVLVTLGDTQTLTAKTLTSPTIAAGALSGTFTGTPTYSGVPVYSGLSAGTQVSCLGLDSGTHMVLNAAACGSGGGGGTPGGSSNDVQYNNAGSFGGITLTNGQLVVGQTSSAPLAKTLSGDATLAASGALTLASTAVTPASYTNTSLTVDAKGRITAASNGSPSAATGVGVQGGQSVSAIGDNTTALPAAKFVYATNANMTAARNHNLPDSVTQGVGDIEIIDAQQTVTSTNTLTVTAAGTDTLNGVTNATQALYAAGGAMRLHNDGAGAWTLVSSNTTPTLNSAQIYVGNASNRPAAVTMSQDGTISNAGVLTVTKTANVSFGALATVVAGTGAATALGVNNGSAGAFQLNTVPYSTSVGWIATVNPNNVTIGILPAAATITSIVGAVETATGGTSTVSVFKAPSGTACSGGTVLHSGSLNANGTAATNQTLTVTTSAIASGNRLCLQTTGSTQWTGGTGIGGITVNYTIP